MRPVGLEFSPIVEDSANGVACLVVVARCEPVSQETELIPPVVSLSIDPAVNLIWRTGE